MQPATVLIAVLFCIANPRPTSADVLPFRNTSLPWNVRVDDLVSRLTIDELVSLGIVENFPPPPITRLDLHEYQYNADCEHGYTGRNATAFPMNLGLAATFRCASCVFAILRFRPAAGKPGSASGRSL